MEQKSAVTFQIYHDEETPVSMYPGLLLFFGLNGSSMLDTVDTNYMLQENEIYIASPLTLYRVRCKEGAALLSMAIAPEIVHEAGWEDKMTADCLLPAGQANDAAHHAVRQRMAALFQEAASEIVGKSRYSVYSGISVSIPASCQARSQTEKPTAAAVAVSARTRQAAVSSLTGILRRRFRGRPSFSLVRAMVVSESGKSTDGKGVDISA